MKFLSFTAATLALLVVETLAQNPGPSPTASVGCVAHNDHWDCEGPAPAAGAVTSSSNVAAAPAETTASAHAEDEDHEAGAAGPGPSPTESTGCVAHGDHWDCEGPASATVTTTQPVAPGGQAQTTTYVTPTVTETYVEDDHTAGSGAAGPSPTESVGCVAHGDHWDCEGPRTTGVVAGAASTPMATEAAEEDDHAAGSGEAGPSPTASVGCVAHGDHWDCEGPRTGNVAAPVTTTTGTAASVTSVTTTMSTRTTGASNATSQATGNVAPFTGGASGTRVQSGLFVGLMGAIAFVMAA